MLAETRPTTSWLSISELVGLLNLALERNCPQLNFEGEISEIKRAQSGHLYFRLKDAQSQIEAVMWAGTARGLSFKPEAGLSVACIGKPGIYHASGRLQVVVHQMQPAGLGALQKKFQELKQKLEREGFFALERKRILPFLPRAIGIVTSRSGAVIHDIMVRLIDRMPCIPVYLVDVRVQGVGSAEEIAAGIRYLDDSGLVDVIITGRGGGSLEDLWAFNEEIVVKAIFRCRVPVVSAVGHETDTSLADLVADRRAPTPTAAAEMVVPRRVDLENNLIQFERRLFDYARWMRPMEQRLDELDGRLERHVQTRLEQAQLRLNAAERSLKAIAPGALLTQWRSRLQESMQRLQVKLGQDFSQAVLILQRLQARLVAGLSVEKLSNMNDKLGYMEQRLETAVIHSRQRAEQQLTELSSRLEAISPKRVLERGFSIVESHGHVVRSVTGLESGEEVKITFFQGGAQAQIKEIFKDKGTNE